MIMREYLSQILLFFQCMYVFSDGWYQFYKDAIANGKSQDKYKVEIHQVKYKGYDLYYRTNTTDIILIICILVKNAQYRHDEMIIDTESVLDLGANIGLFAIKYLANNKVKQPARLIAVEPEKENFKLLNMNLGQFPNVITLNAGIWWRDTKLEIIDHGKGAFAFQVKESESGTVTALSIDTICNEYDVKSALIKMDIEGSEMVVFEHIKESEWINKVRMLIIETHDPIVPGVGRLVRETMGKKGFSVHKSFEDYIFVR